MKRFVPVGVVACVALLMLGPRSGHSDEAQVKGAPPTVVLAQAEDARPAAAPKKPIRGRVPNGYGQLGLSRTQKTTIYTIQAEYEAQIDELEKQIAALEEKRDAEIVAVLTPAQKTALEKAQTEAEAKKAARKRAAEKSE